LLLFAAAGPVPATLQGVVVDRAGKPVAGAVVVAQGWLRRSETKTDKEGKWALRAPLGGPTVLYVSKEGFRFHGQEAGSGTVTLVRRTEKPAHSMGALPPLLDEKRRRAILREVIDHEAAQPVKKGHEAFCWLALRKLAVIDPARAAIHEHNVARYCVFLCLHDLPRAKKVAASLKSSEARAAACAGMAKALAGKDRREATGLLLESFDRLEEFAATSQAHRHFQSHAAQGLLLPLAEEIDPDLVPELFWRSLGLHGLMRHERPPGRAFANDGSAHVALVLSSYDRALAKRFVAQAKGEPPSSDHADLMRRCEMRLDPPASLLRYRIDPPDRERYERLDLATLLAADEKGLGQALGRYDGWYLPGAVDEEDR
ncbi:MAG: carboxypeptidase-like regulatory domain-containing protein, partial [Gemmataceae bacterium]|nr:carboxypeptidase-like regulatory domain-containing protein [Gemmataceae bacterium]